MNNLIKNDEFLFKSILKYTNRAYFVGGFTRSHFLKNDNFSSNDFDIELYDLSLDDFHKLAKELGANGVGKDFFVYKYKNYDIALARKENKIGNKHRDFSVSIEQDEKIACKRRDFTMNAILQNIFTKQYLDFYGGINDCKNQYLRILNYDTFSEDALRVLRACAFIARFKLKISKNDINYMKKMDISYLSKMRIDLEIMKIFNSTYPEIGLYYLYKIEKLNKVFHYNIDKKSFFKILQTIKKNKNIVCQEKRAALFLFYTKYFFNIDIFNNYKKLSSKIIKEEFLVSNDYTLCKLALKIPIKSFIGLNSNIKNRAIKLGIFEDKINIDYSNCKSKEDIFQLQEEKIKELLKREISTL